MSEAYIEVLVQKALSAQKDMQEIKDLIRSQPNDREVLVRIGERIDATQIAIQGMENGIGKINQAIEDSKIEIQSLRKLIYELPGQLSVPREAIDGLKKELRDHSMQLSMPLKQEVRHHHHLTKPILVLTGLIMLVLVMIGLITNTLLKG